MSDKALVTIAAGSLHQQLWTITRPTFERYAECHGYDLIEASLEVDLPAPEWSKVVRLQELVRDYRVVVWVDCDAAISPSAPDIAAYLADSHSFQALTLINYRPRGLVEDVFAVPLLCTGVWAVQQHPTTVRFFDEFWRQTDLLDTPLKEAAPVWRLLGAGEGLGMLAGRPGWLAFPTGTMLLSERWNSRMVAEPESPHIFHATWIGARDQPELRTRLLEEYVATGGVSEALLDQRAASPQWREVVGGPAATILEAVR